MCSEVSVNVDIFSSNIQKLEKEISLYNEEVSDGFKISEIIEFKDVIDHEWKTMTIADYLKRGIEVFKTYNEATQLAINKDWMPTIIKEIGNMLSYYQKCVVTPRRLVAGIDSRHPDIDPYTQYRWDVYYIGRWIEENERHYTLCPIVKIMELFKNILYNKLDDIVEKRCLSEKEYREKWDMAHYDDNWNYDDLHQN